MIKARRHILFVAVTGLTIIRLHAGFDFYTALFGTVTAILCSAIFETISLGCIWSFVYSRARKIMVILPLYLVIAVMAAGAGAVSFHARIIDSVGESRRPVEAELGDRISQVKSSYAVYYSDKIRQVEEKINTGRARLASDPESPYWINRVQQRILEKGDLVVERNQKLDEMPKDKERWVSQNAAVVGLTFDVLSEEIGDASSMTRAIEELFHVGSIVAKKAVAMAIVSIIEFGILLLAFISREEKEEDQVPDYPEVKNETSTNLIAESNIVEPAKDHKATDVPDPTTTRNVYTMKKKEPVAVVADKITIPKREVDESEIEEYLTKNPSASDRYIAGKFNKDYESVYKIRERLKAEGIIS